MNPTKNREKMIQVSSHTQRHNTQSVSHCLILCNLISQLLINQLVPLQVMFEEYQCAGVYIAIQAVLTLYAQGMSCDHIVSLLSSQCSLATHMYRMEHCHVGRIVNGLMKFTSLSIPQGGCFHMTIH